VSSDAAWEALARQYVPNERTIERLRAAIAKCTAPAADEQKRMPAFVSTRRVSSETEILLKWVGKRPGKHRSG